MNTKLPAFIVAILLCTNLATSQIPNASFEFWTNNLPDEWNTNNVSPLLPVTLTTDAYSGTYAIRGEVVDNGGNPYTPSITGAGSSGFGFPINQAYSSLTGWYKANMISSDIGYIQITILDNSPIPNVVGGGVGFLPSSANYQQFSIPISYSGITPPSFALMNFSIVDTGSSLGFVGSYFIFDDLAFSTASQVGKLDAGKFNIQPNPVKDKIQITGEFIVGQSYNICLTNTIGKIVWKDSIKPESTFFPPINVSELPAGNYFLSLSDSKNTLSRRIIIAK